MQVTLDIPDDLAAQFAMDGSDLSRMALEALLVEAYRRRLIYEGDIKRILGFSNRLQVHQLLKDQGVPLDYTEADLEQDRQTMRELFGEESIGA